MITRIIGATALLLFAGSAMAVPVAYSDTNDTGDFWDRPIGGGPSISGLGPVGYHVQAFYTDTDDLYDILSVQDYDGYLHVYAGGFDPLDQLTGLIAGNDDGGGGIGTSDILGLALSAGVQYYIVTSAFAAGQIGNFTNTISDASGGATIGLGLIPPPDPNGVPVPATLMLIGIGLVGMRLARRRSA